MLKRKATMKNYLAFILNRFFFVAGLGVILLLWYTSMSKPHSLPSISSPDTKIEELPTIDDKAFIKAYQSMMTRSEQYHNQTINHKEASNPKTLTFISNTDTNQSKFPSKQLVKPLSTIAFDTTILKNLEPNDEIVLPPIEGQSYTLRITKKRVHNNGNIILKASLQNNSEEYTTTITHGKKLSYATISTPEGIYQIEAMAGEGYLYAVRDIDHALVNYNQSDMIFPKASHSPKTPHHPNESQ